ncbi:MAG TPA: serine hydrolase [Vicinamibacterales bacterium]|nr:serine hydrolase [Vicinamibacterales bacterium]
MNRSFVRSFSLRVILLAFSLLAAVVASAQAPAPGTAAIDKAAQALVTAAFTADGPGGTVIIVKDGVAVYRAARGLASVELGVPLQPDSALRIGSVTKQFTSAAVMMLVEQGKVALDDEITRFFPDYPTRGKRITVEHLLTHTSGIKSYTSLPSWRAVWGKDFTTAELVDLFKNEPMDFDPGEKYQYNNSAYFLLGALIEKVSGTPYAEFVSKNIFTPLGMTSTSYGDTGPIVKGRAQGYARDGGRVINAPYLSMTQPGAAGALVSTVDDLARWDAAVSAGTLLKAASWQRVFTPYRLTNGRSTGYGFGWQVGTFDGHPVQEHGGGIHGFSAYVIRLPEHRVYVAVLANSSDANAGALARKLAALAAGKPLVDPQPISMPPAALAEYAGVYQFDDGKVVVTAADGLRVQPAGGSPARLIPMAPDRFFVPDSFSRFAFERDQAGKVVGLTRTTWNGGDKGRLTSEPLPAARREVKIDPTIFDACVGEYQLAPGFVLTVTREGDRFMSQATGQGKVEIFAASETEFFLKVVDAGLTFVKDAAGKVTGLVLHQNGRDMQAAKIK